MKVKIGPYPDRLCCNIYSRYMNNKYGYVEWPDQQSKFESLLEKLEDFVQTLYTPINYFLDKREQKVNVKIDRWDTWSMDHTLAHIVAPMLCQLKETKQGAPNVDKEDVPEDLWPNEADQLDIHFFARWDWILDEMIWAFEQKILDDGESQFFGEWKEDESKPLGGSYTNVDWDGLKAHQARQANGFRLFGKYYQCLWD